MVPLILLSLALIVVTSCPKPSPTKPPKPPPEAPEDIGKPVPPPLDPGQALGMRSNSTDGAEALTLPLKRRCSSMPEEAGYRRLMTTDVWINQQAR
jgi:hypothetical protein